MAKTTGNKGSGNTPTTTPSTTTVSTQSTTTPSPTAVSAPAPAATAVATGAAASAAPPTPPPTPPVNPPSSKDKKKIARLHIGPTGPRHDEDGNSCLIWTPRGYNVDDNAVKTDIHLVADRPFYLYEVDETRTEPPSHEHEITVEKTVAKSYMIVVTTRGTLEIDVTVPSRRLSIENIRMPGAMRQHMILELVLYAIATALGFYLFGWPFVQIAGGVAGAVLLVTVGVGCIGSYWRRRFFSRAFRWALGSDNRIWLIWMLMCLVATGVAVKNPGDGLIAPAIYEASQNPDAIAHEERMQSFRNLSNGLGFRSDRELGKPTPEKLPPRPWTWFWINAYFWMWGWIIMIPTFADDVRVMSSRMWQRTWRDFGGEASLVRAWPTFLTALRGQTISVPARPHTEQTASATAGEIGSSVFWHSLSANLITELPSILHAFFRR